MRSPRTWTVWRIGGVAVPIPRARHDDRTRVVVTRQWERTFRCTDVDEAQAAVIWDRWAAKRGLRTVSALGPHEMGFTRIYDDGACGVTVTSGHMPGSPMELVMVYVMQHRARRRAKRAARKRR